MYYCIIPSRLEDLHDQAAVIRQLNKAGRQLHRNKISSLLPAQPTHGTKPTISVPRNHLFLFVPQLPSHLSSLRTYLPTCTLSLYHNTRPPNDGTAQTPSGWPLNKIDAGRLPRPPSMIAGVSCRGTVYFRSSNGENQDDDHALRFPIGEILICMASWSR